LIEGAGYLKLANLPGGIPLTRHGVPFNPKRRAKLFMSSPIVMVFERIRQLF